MNDPKRQLTIFLDHELARNALGYAMVNEINLDDLVAELLRERVGEGPYPTIGEYWRGKFNQDQRSDEELLAASDEPRYQYLMRKYLALDSQSSDSD